MNDAAESDLTLDVNERGISPSGISTSRSGGIKVRLTLGPALIDLEATLEEIVRVVTRLTQEFTKAAIISESK